MNIFEEPYFLPPTDRAFRSADESWVQNNQQFRQQQKFLFFRNALDYIVDNDLVGSYFEFGVHKARTFTMAMSLDKFYASNGEKEGGKLKVQLGGGFFTEYVAFDSFEGFPHGTASIEHPIYRAGHVRTGQNEFLELLSRFGQTHERVRLIPGFYAETLNANLANDFRTRSSVASFVTVDCNLYESYRDVLTWTDEFLQPGTVVYLDDFNTFRAQDDRGPRKAWNEFLSSSRWQFTPFLDVGWGGKSFIVQRRTRRTETNRPATR